MPSPYDKVVTKSQRKAFAIIFDAEGNVLDVAERPYVCDAKAWCETVHPEKAARFIVVQAAVLPLGAPIEFEYWVGEPETKRTVRWRPD